MGQSEIFQTFALTDLDMESHFDKTLVHPLLIPLVLDKIFRAVIPSTKPDFQDYDSIKDIQNFRLVCDTWKESCTRILRKRQRPILFGEYRDGCSWKNVGGVSLPDLKLTDFLDTMRESKMIPTTHYILRDSIFSEENQELLAAFSSICLPETANLEVQTSDFCSFYNNEKANFILRNLKLDKLRKLYLVCSTLKMAKFPDFIKILLERATNLREISFETYYGVWNFVGHDSSETIADVFRYLPMSVKTLSLQLPLLDANHFNILAGRGIKLNSLELNCGDITAEASSVKLFLEGQKKSLNSLTVYLRGKFLRLDSKNIPELKELLALKLISLPGTSHLPTFDSDLLPNLKEIDLQNVNGSLLVDKSDELFRKFLSSSKRARSVNILRLPRYIPHAKLVEKASKVFPNLKSLHIPYPTDVEETLQNVFTNFTQIEELYLMFPNSINNYDCYHLNGDALLSGISEEGCKQIQDLGANHIESLNFKDFQFQHSILNLTKLKKLMISNSGQYVFTQFLAHFIFPKLTSLNQVCLEGRGEKRGNAYLI